MSHGRNHYATFILQRYRAILGYTGLIYLIVGGLILSPLLLLYFYPAERYLIPAFLLPGGAFVLLGLGLWWWLGDGATTSLSYQEGSAIVVLAWVLTLVGGMLPFMLGMGLNFTNALFESTSGWTTTGLSVLDVTTTPHLLLFYRSVTQLAGGAGLAIITLSALVGPAGAGLGVAEGRGEQLVPNVRRSAKLVLVLYLSNCLIGTIALYLAGMEWFDAINHAFTALSTGGFSTRTESIGYWDSALVEAVVIVLMLVGTLNFTTSYTLLRGNFRAVARNGELRLEALLIVAAATVLLLGVTTGLYAGFAQQLRVSIFETVTALSTTGFSTVGYGNWNAVGWLTLILLMLVGGGTGSTAGAIKQYRIYVLYRALRWEIRSLFLPKDVVTEPDLWQGEAQIFLSDARIRQVALFVFLYLGTFFIGSLIIAAHGYSFQDSLFEFASSIGTIGLSIGVTAPDAPPGVLWTQIAGMALGRLEFFTIIVGIMKITSDLKQLRARR
jgi:trk system potassium uptake protein